MLINTFIDKTFESQLVTGSISALNYADRLKVFMYLLSYNYYDIFNAFAGYVRKNIQQVKNIFSKGINIIIILFVSITIGAIFLGQPAISFVFERGEFGSVSSLMTTTAFSMYSIGLLPIAPSDVINKVFYSMQDTKSTLYISSFAVGLNVLFNIILIKPMAHVGLALATSLFSIITAPLFFIVLRKKLGALGLKNTLILFAKSCVATAVMGAIVYYGYGYLSSILCSGKFAILMSVGLSAGVGGIVYFTLMILFKVKEMEFLQI